MAATSEEYRALPSMIVTIPASSRRSSIRSGTTPARPLQALHGVPSKGFPGLHGSHRSAIGVGTLSAAP